MGACTVTANYGQDTKRIKNPAAASEEPGEKAICWHQKQGTVHDPPAPNSTKGVDKPPTSPSDRTSGPILTSAHVRKQLVFLGEQTRKSVTCFAPSCCSRGPSKALLISCLAFINFYRLRKAKTLVNINS